MDKLMIENDYVGFLNEAVYYSYTEAVAGLHEAIEQFDHLLTEYPKSKWSVWEMPDGDGKCKCLYSISSAKVRSLKKANRF